MSECGDRNRVPPQGGGGMETTDERTCTLVGNVVDEVEGIGTFAPSSHPYKQAKRFEEDKTKTSTRGHRQDFKRR